MKGSTSARNYMVAIPAIKRASGTAGRDFDVLLPSGANIDIIVHGCRAIPPPGREERVGPISLHMGGGGALCAMGLARLGCRPALWGVVGDDAMGDFVESELSKAGVDTFLEREAGSLTGVSLAFNPETDRSFVTYDGTCTDFLLGRLDLGLLARSRHAHFTGYRGRSNHEAYKRALGEAVEAGCSTSLDLGWDDTGEWHQGIFELIGMADIFFCNSLEALHYTRSQGIDEALAALANRGPTCVVKLGSEGSAAVDAEGIHRSEAFEVAVVDTTGAGDSFDAGYLYGFLAGLPVSDCLLLGNACGGLSVTKAGGSSAFPGRAELAGFISARGRLPGSWAADRKEDKQ